MYIPPYFQMTDKARVHALMRAHNFALLVTQGRDGLHITHLPFFLDEGEGDLGTLYGHMARANSHWMALMDAGESRIVFSGPHAYISPTWYTEPNERVPTWNYAAVHAHGRAALVEEAGAAEILMARLVQAHEGADGWSADRLNTERRAALMAGIVCFKIEISRIEAKAKLDQNKPEKDRLGAAARLAEAGQDDIALLMREVGI